MMRAGGSSRINPKILLGNAQQISQHWFEAESEALLRAFRNIGHEVAALPDSFRDNHPEVPWSTMAAWADDAQFPDSSFSPPLFQQWLHTFAELYDKALEYHVYNVRNLKLEIASGSDRWKRTEQQWALAAIFFIAAAIAARICSIP